MAVACILEVACTPVVIAYIPGDTQRDHAAAYTAAGGSTGDTGSNRAGACTEGT